MVSSISSLGTLSGSTTPFRQVQDPEPVVGLNTLNRSKGLSKRYFHPAFPINLSLTHHEPASHENRSDLLECTTRQRSLNRRGMHRATAHTKKRGAPMA